MSMQNKTFFCKVVFDGPEYIVNNVIQKLLPTILSHDWYHSYYSFH